MKRRNILKGLSLLPFAGAASVFKSSASPEKNILDIPGDFFDEQNIFRSIGVEPVINCRGTFTIIGGSVERPEVRAAMDAASKYFVQIDELADAVGRRFAELTWAEWGMVSAGGAAGLKHVTIACVTGGQPG